MTNSEIIFRESCELLRAGKIKPTGRTVTVETTNGEKMTFQEPEQIHTFAAWKQIGFSVKKGEKAVAAFPIWKYRAGKTEIDANGDEQTGKAHMFLKVSHFFTQEQVEPLKRKSPV